MNKYTMDQEQRPVLKLHGAEPYDEYEALFESYKARFNKYMIAVDLGKSQCKTVLRAARLSDGSVEYYLG